MGTADGWNGNSGTGGAAGAGNPSNGQNGAVYRVSLIKDDLGRAGTGYAVLAASIATTIVGGGGGTGLTIIIESVTLTGQITSIRIGQPGGGYGPASVVTITGGGGDAQVQIEAVGQSVDVTNAITTVGGDNYWNFRKYWLICRTIIIYF